MFTFDVGHKSKPFHNGFVREDAAKLVLKQRMKPTQSIFLGTHEEEVMELLNHFGGQQAPLFSDWEFIDSRQRLLIVLEGVDNESCK